MPHPPHPDPNGVCIRTDEDGSFSITAELWWHGKRHRLARVRAIAENIRRDGWRCLRCGTKVPPFKRADARYCLERCRKAEARTRRALRLASFPDATADGADRSYRLFG
jgi:hypothetical protein